MRYGMVIDLGRCIGCQACSTSCKVTHGTPKDVFWSKVEFSEKGTYPKAYREFLPTLCMHCKDAPCEKACLPGATKIDKNGIVTVDYNECIACMACVAACPYDARTLMKEMKGYFDDKNLQVNEKQQFGAFTKDTVSKCTFCKDRLAEGDDPACVKSCVTNARYFGDLDDPNSTVNKVMKGREVLKLKPEEKLDTAVRYLTKTQG